MERPHNKVDASVNPGTKLAHQVNARQEEKRVTARHNLRCQVLRVRACPWATFVGIGGREIFRTVARAFAFPNRLAGSAPSVIVREVEQVSRRVELVEKMFEEDIEV